MSVDEIRLRLPADSEWTVPVIRQGIARIARHRGNFKATSRLMAERHDCWTAAYEGYPEEGSNANANARLSMWL